jgi:type IV pilus assembly protein PilW
MNTLNNMRGSLSRDARQQGFTLVELMVTVGIALFLLGGLVTILQNVRQANLNQQALAQLQDQQRFAMTVIADMIQQAGYYPNYAETQSSAMLAAGVFAQNGQAFFGTAGPPDSVTVRFNTIGGDGVIMCDGSTLPVGAAEATQVNQFTVVPPAGNVPGQLLCSLNGALPVPLANGVTNMQISYGVNRANPLLNYNVDTYLTADQMLPGLPNGGDWNNVSSVRVVLTFTNPLYAGPASGQQPTITFERVVMVMGRAGVHS